MPPSGTPFCCKENMVHTVYIPRLGTKCPHNASRFPCLKYVHAVHAHVTHIFYMLMSQAHVLYLSLSAFYTRCSAHIQSTYSARSVHAWETLYLNNIEREGGRQGGASTLLNDIDHFFKHLLHKLKRNSLLSESDGSGFSLQFAHLTC